MEQKSCKKGYFMRFFVSSCRRGKNNAQSQVEPKPSQAELDKTGQALSLSKKQSPVFSSPPWLQKVTKLDIPLMKFSLNCFTTFFKLPQAQKEPIWVSSAAALISSTRTTWPQDFLLLQQRTKMSVYLHMLS